MDPITAINREFTRTVVNGWSTEGTQHRSKTAQPWRVIGAALQALAAWFVVPHGKEANNHLRPGAAER